MLLILRLCLIITHNRGCIGNKILYSRECLRFVLCQLLSFRYRRHTSNAIVATTMITRKAYSILLVSRKSPSPSTNIIMEQLLSDRGIRILSGAMRFLILCMTLIVMMINPIASNVVVIGVSLLMWSESISHIKNMALHVIWLKYPMYSFIIKLFLVIDVIVYSSNDLYGAFVGIEYLHFCLFVCSVRSRLMVIFVVLFFIYLMFCLLVSNSAAKV